MQVLDELIAKISAFSTAVSETFEAANSDLPRETLKHSLHKNVSMFPARSLSIVFQYCQPNMSTSNSFISY